MANPQTNAKDVKISIFRRNCTYEQSNKFISPEQLKGPGH